MNHDPEQCETCLWPLGCCTEDGAPPTDPAAVDCPRAHAVWERRLGDTGLDAMSTAPIEAWEIEEAQEEEEEVLV